MLRIFFITIIVLLACAKLYLIAFWRGGDVDHVGVWRRGNGILWIVLAKGSTQHVHFTRTEGVGHDSLGMGMELVTGISRGSKNLMRDGWIYGQAGYWLLPPLHN